MIDGLFSLLKVVLLKTPVVDFLTIKTSLKTTPFFRVIFKLTSLFAVTSVRLFISVPIDFSDEAQEINKNIDIKNLMN